LEVVAVSGTNQYTVKPWELTRTCLPPMVSAVRVVPPEAAGEAGLLAWAAGVLPEAAELLAELPHAEAISAAAASPAAPHIFLIRGVSFTA
jgi:hypothetical protein